MKYIVSILIALSILFFSVGCAGSTYHPTVMNVHMDNTFSDIERVEILSGMYAWQTATESRVLINEVVYESHDAVIMNFIFNPNVLSDDVYVVNLSEQADFCPNNKGRLTGNAVGMTIKNGYNYAECLLTPWANEHKFLRRISLHEFGHVLGLTHYEGPAPSVMHPIIDDCSDEISCVDIQQFCSLNKCNVKCE